MLQKFQKSPKNINYLNRKTKRENFLIYKTIDVPKTIITLVYISTKSFNFNDYSYIKFSFSEKINLDELIQKKVQSLTFDINSNKIYIIDKIELGNEDENIKETFIVSIYLKKTNIWYINLKPKKKGYSFEIIFHSNSEDKLPKHLLFKNTLILKQFDEYNLKYRKKVCAINVEKNFTNDYIKNLYLDHKSYKLCVRIKDNGKTSTSVHQLKIEEKTNCQISELRANTNSITRILKFFDELKENKSIKTLKEKYKDLDDDNAFKKFIKSYIYAKKSYTEIPNISDDDVNLLKEFILKLIVKYFFIGTNEIQKNAEKKRIDKFNKLSLKVVDNIKQIIEDIEIFTKNKEESIILKYRLYRATLYNLYSIIYKYSSKKFICLKILSKYNQKIIDINFCSNGNPYYNAINFLEKVADNLNEKSCLFEFLLQYNSGISEDIKLLRRTKTKNDIDINCSKYELSMQTVEEVAKHLKEILPKFVIRYISDKDNYAFYSCIDDLIFLNEKKAFKNDTLTDLDGDDENTLPIVFLLLHKCLGHKKVASNNLISNKISKYFPIRNNLKSENFEENIVFIKSEEAGEIKGESGLEIEFLITGLKYPNIISRHLLNNEDENNQKLLDVKLWVQPDFLEFQKLVVENIKEFYKLDDKKFLKKNRKKEDNIDNKRNTFENFFEDDVEIGILFKA